MCEDISAHQTKKKEKKTYQKTHDEGDTVKDVHGRKGTSANEKGKKKKK
jgi:hypothetical protein